MQKLDNSCFLGEPSEVAQFGRAFINRVQQCSQSLCSKEMRRGILIAVMLSGKTLSAAPAGSVRNHAAPVVAATFSDSDSSSALPPLQPLDATALDADWQALLERMHAVERVAAPFVEARRFPFRKKPKHYRGTFRKAADGRISLAYAEPEEIALHIGAGFAYYRKGEGTVRRIPHANEQSSALALFPQLLNFDLAGLSAHYALSGAIEGDVWQLALEAQSGTEQALPYQSMRVEGRGTAVERIELYKNKKQRIVIEMGAPVYPEFYLPEIRAQYFFCPDSE